MTRRPAPGAVVLLAITCAACSAPPRSPPRSPPPAGPRPAVAALASADPADDWRRLIVAPLGTRLQEMPFALNETVFFSEAAGAGPAAGAPGAGDCFTPRGTLPSFAGAVAQSFVLCFAQERLSLIQAAIDLPRASAADTLRRYCDLWLSGTGGGTRSDAGCSGHDGDAAFSARLDLDAADPAGRLAVAVFALNADQRRP